ncbi:AHH domain-containing protein [Shewanella woodyi]|uniref:AHH domain-containing protein n=1 Tax=Shewanella woodyi TaxID=60961 RepID=UPI003749FBE6
MLAKHDIDINGADNGVFLPNKNNTSDMPGILDNGRHPDKYLESVNKRIIDADKIGGKEAVLDELSSIKNTLSSADSNASWYTILN